MARSTAVVSRELLEPILKAYALAYLTSTLPRLPDTVKRINRSRDGIQYKLNLLRAALTSAIGRNRFPTACALIVAGSTTLSRLVKYLILLLHSKIRLQPLRRLLLTISRHVTAPVTFLSAWHAFALLNDDEKWARKRAKSMSAQRQQVFDLPNQHHAPPPGYRMRYAGKTLDLTLFAFCRAIDSLVVTVWLNTKMSKLHPENLVPRFARLATTLADPWVFATSSAIIMWSWFYAPERLPRSYNQWITKIAALDSRLINALRLARSGYFVYGEPSSYNANLPAFCKELGLPEEWGEPSTVIPVPCEVVHSGIGKSCEVHAGHRFFQSFLFAMRLYLPLQLFSLFRSPLTVQRLLKLLRDAATSSSFLAAFVAFFYYGVCLARTRLGPRIFSYNTVTPQMWDSGLCVLAGCLTCGWSLGLEKPGRRQELALFVAPRALATLLPRIYDKRDQRTEQVVFASSVAVLMTALKSRDARVRGVLGSVLGRVIR